MEVCGLRESGELGLGVVFCVDLGYLEWSMGMSGTQWHSVFWPGGTDYVSRVLGCMDNIDIR